MGRHGNRISDGIGKWEHHPYNTTQLSIHISQLALSRLCCSEVRGGLFVVSIFLSFPPESVENGVAGSRRCRVPQGGRQGSPRSPRTHR